MCSRAGAHAAHDWIILADSNVLMPRDYIQLLFASWRPIPASSPRRRSAAGRTDFWAELECAFLNTYQARWQYVADALGFGFAQGKTMLWRRADLERAGGIEALAKEVAEDAASTKIVRGAGLKVRLVDRPFAQPLGRRSAAEVWNRQLRWARLRRASFLALFSPGGFLRRRAADDRGCRRRRTHWAAGDAERRRCSARSGTAAKCCLPPRPDGTFRRAAPLCG